MGIADVDNAHPLTIDGIMATLTMREEDRRHSGRVIVH
jgi:hypothetical protein